MASLVGFRGFDTLNVKREKRQLKVIKNNKSTFRVALEETQAHNVYAPTRGASDLGGKNTMTKSQRTKLLKKAYELLDEAYLLLDEANNEEAYSLEGWAENLQQSERYERAEERAQMVEDIFSTVEEQRDTLESVINDDF